MQDLGIQTIMQIRLQNFDSLNENNFLNTFRASI